MPNFPQNDFATFFGNLLSKKNQQLSWDWVPDENVGDGTLIESFAAHESYLIVRLAEMFLKDKRILWRTFYPVVHSFLHHGGHEFSEIAGPGQLKDLGSANLDRLVGLAYPLTEPVVYDGSDVDLLIGLYAVPAQDAAKVLLNSLGQLSVLTGLSIEVAAQVATVVKLGIEGLLQIDGNSLQLGARDTLRPIGPKAGGKVAKPGYLVAVNTPAGNIEYDKLWVKDGRLCKGDHRDSAKPFSEWDYMLVEIERRETRADWRTLPEVQKHEKGFDEAIRSGQPIAEIKTQIVQLWTPFSLDVGKSVNLTIPDKRRVMKSVGEEIKVALELLGNNAPWETRSAALRKAGVVPRKGFTLLAAEDAFASLSKKEIEKLGADAYNPPV
jgi:hypothetical protein